MLEDLKRGETGMVLEELKVARGDVGDVLNLESPVCKVDGPQIASRL